MKIEHEFGDTHPAKSSEPEQWAVPPKKLPPLGPIDWATFSVGRSVVSILAAAWPFLLAASCPPDGPVGIDFLPSFCATKAPRQSSWLGKSLRRVDVSAIRALLRRSVREIHSHPQRITSATKSPAAAVARFLAELTRVLEPAAIHRANRHAPY